MASASQRTDLLVIGSGFGGLALGVSLKKAGLDDFTLLEKSAVPGGVWRDNTYPGCACDVPSRFYSFSFEQNWNWSSRFGQQKEILDYFNHCMDKYGIRSHVRTGSSVKNAHWDEKASRWQVETAAGERYETRVLVSGMGLFNQVVYPDIKGRESFAGPSWHSSEWRHDVDIKGKRVAVIGTGASANSIRAGSRQGGGQALCLPAFAAICEPERHGHARRRAQMVSEHDAVLSLRALQDFQGYGERHRAAVFA